jgi:hypothetical protein
MEVLVIESEECEVAQDTILPLIRQATQKNAKASANLYNAD